MSATILKFPWGVVESAAVSSFRVREAAYSACFHVTLLSFWETSNRFSVYMTCSKTTSVRGGLRFGWFDALVGRHNSNSESFFFFTATVFVLMMLFVRKKLRQMSEAFYRHPPSAKLHSSIYNTWKGHFKNILHSSQKYICKLVHPQSRLHIVTYSLTWSCFRYVCPHQSVWLLTSLPCSVAALSSTGSSKSFKGALAEI